MNTSEAKVFKLPATPSLSFPMLNCGSYPVYILKTSTHFLTFITFESNKLYRDIYKKVK